MPVAARSPRVSPLNGGGSRSCPCPPLCLIVVGVCLIVLSLIWIILGALLEADVLVIKSRIGKIGIALGVIAFVVGIGLLIGGAFAASSKAKVTKQEPSMQPGFIPQMYPGYHLNTYPMAYPVYTMPHGGFPHPPDYALSSSPPEGNKAPGRSSSTKTGSSKSGSSSKNSRSSDPIPRSQPLSSSSSTITVEDL